MTAASSTRPDPSEYAEWYAGYVARVPEGDVVASLRDGRDRMKEALGTLPETMGDHRYAEGKWSVRTVIGHLIDAERIFSYRALRIARGDATPLPSFDQAVYAAAAESDDRRVTELVAELLAVRDSTTRLFASLPDAAWTRTGTASAASVSVRAIAYITAGHSLHHLAILKDRYDI
ncbi:MAG: DinB family protein [Gemmatimonadota bacterium]|nr:DinB family protein [Gemmatimonadota bacterium]